MLHEMEGMAMTDAEIEDFFNFMDQGPGCGGPGGGLHSGPLAAFAAADLSDAGTPGDAGAAAPASSSDGNGSSEQQDSRMRDAPRSPGSSEDCTGGGAAAGMQIPCRPQPAHHHHPAAYAAAGAHYAQQHHQPAGLGRLPEGEAYPPAGAGAGAPAAAAVPVPMPVARAASAAELAASAGRAAPDMLRAHSAASLGSLTHPLEGLALGSPAVVAGPSMAAAAADGPAAAAAMAQAAGGAPPMVMFGAAAAHGGGHFATPFSMVSMGAFAPAGVAYMPAAALAACGSAPPGAVSLASTLDAGGDPAVGGGGMCGAQLSTSWPSAAAGGCAASAPSLSAAAAAAAAAGLSRQRSTGASKPPSSGRAGAVRSRSGSADATYHRSSGGGGNLSHSTIEKQRRDRLNSLLDELGAMVPPSDGRSDGSRRPKHVILSDAIALLSSLQERLRLGGDEIAALRQRLAAAEPGGGPAGAGGLDAACGGGGGAAGAGAGGARLPQAGRSAPRPIIPQQAAQQQRQKDKFVALPEDEEDAAEATGVAAALAASGALPGSLVSDDGAALLAQLSDAAGITDETALQALAMAPGIFEDLPASMLQPPPSRRGRITLYGLAGDFDRDRLHEVLCASFPPAAIKVFPDAFHISYAPSSDDAVAADVYCFDYGVVACWGLDALQESSFVRNIASHGLNTSLADANDDVEIDQFQFNVSTTERPHIQNDIVTLHRKAAADHKVKLAISYALSQSTMLSLYERRVTDLVLESKHLPEQLAQTGEVTLTSEDVAKLIGRVFLHRAAVNLLGSVLDTPEFFWREADSYQALYSRICEYLELSERVEVLNARFSVLQEMLDMLRDHLNNQHSSRLEVIVIVLIFVEVLVGLVELMGLFGWFK